MHFNRDESFVWPLSSFIQQSLTLNKVHYLAERDVFKVTWFHKGIWILMWPVPYSHDLRGRFRCLLASVTLGTIYQPQFKWVSM